MKKVIGLLLISLFIISGCSKKSYEGYWCTYQEEAMIIILLDKDISTKNKDNVEDTINTFEDLESYDYISRKDLAENDSNNNLYDTYFVHLDSVTNIDNYIASLANVKGIHSTTKSINKNNLSLYNLKNKKEFTYQTNLNDPATIIEGTYKIKDNKIVFKSDKEVPELYIKDNFICLDKNCNTIYSKTNNLCESN